MPTLSGTFSSSSTVTTNDWTLNDVANLIDGSTSTDASGSPNGAATSSQHMRFYNWDERNNIPDGAEITNFKCSITGQKTGGTATDYIVPYFKMSNVTGTFSNYFGNATISSTTWNTLTTDEVPGADNIDNATSDEIITCLTSTSSSTGFDIELYCNDVLVTAVDVKDLTIEIEYIAPSGGALLGGLV